MQLITQWQNHYKEIGPTRCANKRRGWNNSHMGFDEHAKGWLIHHLQSTTQIEGS
jgi:hypothetical protein